MKFEVCSVAGWQLPADAETLGLTQERKRAERERDFTGRRSTKAGGPRCCPRGWWSRPTRDGRSIRVERRLAGDARLRLAYEMTLQRVDESGNPL